jgi:GWxTD domain-containing protein
MGKGYGKHGALLAAGLMLGLVLAAPAAWAQRKAAPEFDVDAVSVRGNGASGTRLDLYTKIPYGGLRFINTPNGFTARYSVTVEAHTLNERNRPQALVQTRVWEQQVTVAEFAQTQADQLFDRTLQTLELKPGRYLLQFQLEDQATTESFVRELPVEVRDLAKPVAISDLILIDAYNAEANSITPTISSQVSSDQSHFKLFYEVYTDRPQRVRITSEVVLIRKGNGGGPPTVRSLFGLERGGTPAETSYQEVEPQRLQRGRNQFVVEIPIEGFTVGEYAARVKVQDEEGRSLDQAERPLTVQWSGLAEHVRDLNEAVAQLSYIAKDKDLSFIREARTDQERKERFLEFWKRRDPTPGTERNERMEEYYYRIAYANRQYGNFIAGWKTDRGHVMVLFGEPDYVERHPYNFNVKPYEVWYYYGIGRRFIFIDKTGFGDYELLVPIWDERNRIR